jgi:hypothetical protein
MSSSFFRRRLAGARSIAKDLDCLGEFRSGGGKTL